MDPNDAARVLKDMLKIGQENDTADNGERLSLSAQENQDQNDSFQSDARSQQENNLPSESFDSFQEQESPRIALNPVNQLVHFSPDEQKGSIIVYGNDVHISTGEIGARPDTAGSNRVRINPVVNFEWESKYYNGNLLSVSAKYMAYALRGKSGFVVRILHRKTLLKTLIKGFTGSIEDLAFAHYNSDVLACTDSAGDVFVWSIYEEGDKISYNLRLHLKRTSTELTFLEGTRLTWCPYIEESDADDYENEATQILAVTVGSVAEVLHISIITDACGSVVDIENVKQGIIRIENGHNKALGDISLAPDGSVLATASEDGGVKFWKLNFESAEPPDCLHEWQPHEGKPVSRLVFCDNLLLQDDKSPFWRFLLTGAEHNSELKIWCTVTWTCLQTIRFELPASSLSLIPTPPLKFKVSLDLSAKYLVVSDVNRKVLYVFLLHEDLDEGKAHVTSVAQFPLTQPLLSFVITEAKMFKASVGDSLVQNGNMEGKEKLEDEPEEPGDDDVKLLPTIKIKLHCIDPKAMQELTVQYHPFASIRPQTPSTVANVSMTSTETGVQDGLSDISGLDTSSTEEVETKSDHASTTPKLIAPNAFTSTLSEPTSNISSITSVTSMNNSSYTSISIQDLLGTSNTMSDRAFQTCEEDTLLEEPTGKPFPILHGHNTSPLGLPLPESPDPAKVPFPAFKPEATLNVTDMFASLSHSTPINRQSEEQEDETDKTPTAQSTPTLSEHEMNNEEQPVSQNSMTVELESSYPGASKTLLKPGDLEAGAEHLQATASIESTLSDLPEPKPMITHEDKASQWVKTKPNLTVTPRKQINISPDEDRPQTSTGGNRDVVARNLQLEEIISLLRTQQTEINQLKCEVQNHQRQQNQRMSEVLREEVAMLESAISSNIEATLADHAKEQDHKLDSLTRDKQSGEKQKNEKLANAVSAAVTTKTEKAVKNEVRNSVNSGFQKLTASLQDQLNTTMAQKLTATDTVVKESVSKMIVDKNVIDAVGDAVGNAMQKRLQVFMTEFTSSTMLPGFDRACQALFNQINTAFQKGTQQYIRSFETYSTGQVEMQREQRDPIVQQLESLVQDFQASAEKLSTNMSGSLSQMMQTQLTSSMKRLQSNMTTQLKEDLNKSIQETIQKEVRSSIMEHGIPEPMSHSSPQMQRRSQQRIRELINHGDFPEAFQEALTASDLNLVVMVCREGDAASIFSQHPCPLSQPTLLSLIQQLSVDLSADTEIKHSYLSEAIMALDTSDPITQEHVATILSGLCHQIKATMQELNKTDPTNALQRSLKMLLMAAQSLIK